MMRHGQGYHECRPTGFRMTLECSVNLHAATLGYLGRAYGAHPDRTAGFQPGVEVPMLSFMDMNGVTDHLAAAGGSTTANDLT